MIDRPPIWIVMSLNNNREASIHAMCTEKDRAELYKIAIEKDPRQNLMKVWITETEANHLWMWNLAQESRPINARDYLPQLEYIDQLKTTNAALLEALEETRDAILEWWGAHKDDRTLYIDFEGYKNMRNVYGSSPVFVSIALHEASEAIRKAKEVGR